MKTQEAKFILQAYRPGGEDANDPQFAEALEQVKRDPELAAWFAEQVAFDAAAARALKQVQVPSQLRENILVGQRVIKPSLWWKRPLWGAIAASFLVLLCIGGLWFKSGRSTRFENYLDQMSLAADSKGGHLDIETKDQDAIHAWFVSHNARTNFDLPARLSGVPSMGCRVLDWHGHKISMLCYVLEESKHVDLFVAQRSDFPNPPEYGQLRFGRSGRLTTSSWSQANQVYALIGPEDESFFRKYIDSNDLIRKQALWIAPH